MAGLYIDDLRNPQQPLDIARNSQEAINYVKQNGCPSYISFDHDLGGDDTAMNFVKWLVEYDMDQNGTVIPENFDFNVHSANPVGAKNIESYLLSYLNQRDMTQNDDSLLEISNE